eukprot:7379923-Prymnesium_polylepis.1
MQTQSTSGGRKAAGRGVTLSLPLTAPKSNMSTNRSAAPKRRQPQCDNGTFTLLCEPMCLN